MAELNAAVEDPNLWSDPERAQGIMRERQRLEDGIGAVEALERELADNLELIELGQAESDQDVIDDAE